MKEEKIIIDSLKEIKEAKQYWLNICSKPIEKLSFPRDSFGDLQYDKKSFNFVLKGDLYNKSDKITNGENLTVCTLLLSVLKIELFKYNMQNDLIIGLPVYFNSNEKDSLNKVVLTRSYLEDNMTFKQVLLELRKTIIETYKNQIVSLEEILKLMDIDNDIMSLLPINFAMKNIHSEEDIEYIVNSPKNEITFLIEKVDNAILFEVIFNSKLFEADTIQRFCDIYLNIFNQVFSNLEVRLFEIEMLTDVEKHKLLFEFNNTNADYPRDKTIHELFEEKVEKTPDNIAIVFEDNKLTYRELNEKSNRLARTLREKGVKADSIVGIMTERSIEMIVGIMAILKAGGAYLPIDPDYPEDRKRYILKDSNSKLVLIQKSFIEKSIYGVEVLMLNDENSYESNTENLDKITESYNIAYVIYTSGTTGKPKGVMVEHKSLNNFLLNIYKQFNCEISSNDRCLSLTNISFDVSVAEVFVPLLNNAALVLFNNEEILDIQKLTDIIVKEDITFSYIPPTILRNVYELLIMNKEKLRLNKILVGVEPIKDYILEEYMNLNSNMQIINGYGPTEATICTTMYKYVKKGSTGKNVPIGQPMLNTRIYIVNNRNKIVPIGVAGELCISGDGLARGYIKNQELTAEKFVENPYEPGERMYRTGDLAKWLPDGNIEFHGRIDHQVKIRGFRIELGEIESQLLKYEDIKELIVLDREDKNEAKYLCAYIVAEKELTVGELRKYLSKNLPEYMIPSYFVQLDKMPLTPNGKIDRKALPEPDGSIVTGSEYEAARNEVEEKLIKIWSEVLGVEKVGINDNFFELGGHSLKATALVSKMHKELNVEVPLREIFKFPTIKGSSEYIESTVKSIYSSIKIVEGKEYYEVSSAQKRMYMLQQFDLKSTGYNMPGVMLVEGRLNEEKLEESFIDLIRRHETLRTSFETIEDKIVQRVNTSVSFKVESFEVGCAESTDNAVGSIIKDFVKEFDLTKAPLLRVGLIKLQEDKHILMVDMHHIISDGVSMRILINEFVKIYDGSELKQLRIQYKDYSEWQNVLLKSEVMQEQKEYWINRFKDEIPVLNIRADFQRPLIQSFEGDNISFKLDKELTKNLRLISRETGSTMYMVLLSGINILLSKHSGQEDIIVGSPIAGRPHSDLLKIIGMFVNTLAMRNHPDGSKTYEDFLKEVKENALKAYENQDYQFDELVDNLSISRDISRNPLFDVMFIMQNIDSEETPLKDLVFKGYKQEHKVAKFDLTFSASDTAENIILNLEYSTKLYKKETIETMMEHLVNILKAAVADTKIKISEMDMLTEGEKHKLLFEFNDTYADYPRDKTIHELFEEKVLKTPDNVAVICEDRNLTYRELNNRANRLARILREKGVKADSIVGIMVERSFEMIVGIMAILKAGGAYLPIDPWYPEERIKYMLTDSKTKTLLTQRCFVNSVEFKGDILDIQDENIYSKNECNLENINMSKDVAYVIYTSGSTGKSKGVIIEHGSVINTLMDMENKYALMEDDSYLMKTSYTFDVSVTELFGWFIGNGRLVILNPGVEKDAQGIINVIEKHKVTHVNFVPSMLDVFVDELRNNTENVRSLKYVFVAGEAISRNLANKFLHATKTIKLENIYGPTETTIYVTKYSLENLSDEFNVPIGKPFNNTRAYIIDRNNKLQPIGVTGELCISGEGLARGYINKLELTAEKFIESPFISGERMYKTGDLARWLPDGNIEFLGRIDHQVKIRGFRIELGEIESQLLKHESVKEAIVLDKEDENGSKYLCAYLVSEKELTVGELRNYLSKNLPEYMLPSYFVQLDKMPLTSNGKTDRKALPEPDGGILTGVDYEAPRNAIEEKLMKIWSEVLGVGKIGINDNFFELGGHSLKATVLSSRMHKELDVEVPLKEIFKFPTIKGSSEYIQSTEKSMYSSIEIVEEKEYYEASSAQKRMYLLQKFDLDSTGYNMPGVMLVEGRLNEEKLEKSFIELVRRHETLRTSFETIEDKIVQRVNAGVNFKLDCFEVGCIESTDKAIDTIVKDFVKAFDLNNAPLLRVGLIKLEEGKHILMFDMHHIISDGVSMGILINEFAKIYEGNELEQLRIQYKDYSQWQNTFLKSDVIQAQKEYWTSRFKGEIPVLNIKTDFERPLLQSFEGESISFKLDYELTKDLKKISRETGSTMYMVLLSGVNILLSKYSGQEDIIVGSPIAGRPHADIEKIIGMFVNTLAMRNYPDGNRTYEDFLREVKENALEAYENQDYQFDELVDKLSIPRDISRNALFDVMFTMQNLDSQDIELKDLVFKQYKQENKVAKFDLTFAASETVGNIIINLQYCTKLYKRETIEIMISHLVNILKTVTADRKVKLSEIEMITVEEKHKLLYEFNDTYADYPRDKTIHELFEEQAHKTPDNIAIVFKDEKLTYGQLNQKANKLARNLRERGVKQDSIVGIMVERSLYMIVGIMGILKAGGAYLPIDPEYPEDRIKYMLEDSNTKILLTQSSLLDRIETNATVLDIQNENMYAKEGYNLENINTSKDLAYVIYTSGSTGNPKGTEVSHYNVSRVIKNTNYISITKDDIILQLSNYAFDGSVFDIYGALINGAKLILIEKETVLNTRKLSMLIIHEKVSIFFVTTALFNILVDNEIYCFNNIRKVMFGGERISISHAKKALEYMGQNKIIHVYGPTESTVFTTYYFINVINENTESIPIGSPIANTKVYIIGKNSKLSPIGVSGELCIAGEGLARGYLNNAELTAEKFIESPFVSGEKIYKTGDLARWLPDGNIEFLGRIDHQVKIRGFRIELGEIESQLLSHESVKEVIVFDREDEDGAKYLCAYLVPEKELTVGELRSYLSKNLPEYMIPSYFVQLDKMPLTSNGKIDRKSLPKPEGRVVTGTVYEAPRNEVEERLVKIWSEVLGVEKVGINDNFFELGGHSLKATVLSSRMHKELDVEVPLKEIFKVPTIKGTSQYIESTEKSIYSSIEMVEEKEYYEASSAQKRMYMLQQFDLKSIGYNMPGVMLVEGRLQVEKLEESFKQLIRRHETLRTSFETIEDKIIQRINESVNFKLDVFEVNCTQNAEKAVDNIVRDFVKVFNLGKAPLLRVGLIKLEQDKYILMFDMHHIISDGVSMGILTNEFAKIYESNELEQLRIQYKDYSQWQNCLLKSEVMQAQKEYWISRFKDEIPVLNLPTDFQRPLMQSFEGENIRFKLDKEITKDLKRVSKETGSTMYMVLLSGVNILLSKYSGQEDIIVGSPIAGRPHADLQKIIGMFVNTLAMRNHPKGDKTYEDFLKEVKKNALKAYENQDYQFDELVDNLSIPRDISRNPLFDVMFTMQNIDSENIQLKDLIFKAYKQEHKVAKFDLTFSANEVGDEIIFELEYSKKLYKRETIERMVEHFANIIKVVTGDIKIKLSEVEMLTEDEKHKLLYEFNDTYSEYPRDKAIHELFEEQVEKIPDSIAVVFEDKKLTYRELNHRANRLARKLREKGVKPDDIVGIMAERSIEMLVGIIGILKSGGAYLPIDPEYPEDRIVYMLGDSKAKVLLTQECSLDKIHFDGEIINIQSENVYGQSGEKLCKVITSKNLAYVIYTSGSTGNPKGVMVDHKSVIRLVKNTNYISFEQNDKILQTGTLAFDASTFEIWGALLNGLELHLGSKNMILNTESMELYINENGITVLWLTASLFNFMAKERPSMFINLRYLLAGGDVLSTNYISKVIKECRNLKIVNGYGPTENTTFSTCFLIDKEYKTNIPIGSPISNSTAYIMDKYDKLQPMGIYGELCVGGEGLARGYLNKPELTTEKFIESPFVPGERMYKTGDLARWLPDGNIEFFGRMDHQVKIRGFRIELGEIEGQLLSYEAIKEIIVIDREDESNNKYLCAYLVSEKELTIGELRAYLSKKLPEYMIPSYFIQIDKMPLTPNGKIDRKALPEPDGSIVTGTEYEASRNEVEEKLVAIWKDVLEVERVGINDNFFELGGHSLKATTVVSRIHKELNAQVPLREMFKLPTIKGISEYIESTEKSIYSSIEIVEEKEYYEASSAQKRIYMLQQFDIKGVGYNMPGVMLIEGKVNVEILEKSFVELVRRHETLRTSFEAIEDTIMQRISENVNFKLEYFEVGCVESQEKAAETIIKDFVKAFDLNKAPLLRVGLIKLEQDKYILMVDMHHIISDGASMEILTSEFAKIYEGNKLGQLRIQYKDYSKWQNSLLKSDVMKEQKEYWLNRFKDEVPVLNIRTDFQRPLMQSFEGENISFKLDKELTKNLKRISKETGSTMYMVLLSGVNILLSKYSGQEDIIVGSPIAGRPHADLEKIIGMFVNTLAMRNYPDGNKTYEEFLKEVKENALKAYENQDYQFDELVDKLNIPRDISRNPLFDVMFTMQNIDSEKTPLKDLIFRAYKQEHKVAKFDLTFSASEMVENIILNLQYSTRLYKKETIERMIEHLVKILKSVAIDTKIKLSEIDMLTEGEKHKLLFEFNDTYAEYPRNKTIQELFEEQVLKTPDNIAVVFEDKKLTYRELNVRANKLARTLREKGVKPDSIVGIMVEPSLEMIVGMFGVLKSGGAYLPIDPEYPVDRIKHMIQDSNTKILLTQSNLIVGLELYGKVINLEDEKVYLQNGKNLENINTSSDLAYVIYTSGSTGRPKGVMIEHRSISTTLQWRREQYNLNSDDSILQLFSSAFDGFVTSFYTPIISGSQVVILSDSDAKDVLKIRENILLYKTTHFIAVPSMCLVIMESLTFEEAKSLRIITLAGESLTTKVVEKCKTLKEKLEIVNEYGPTENSVVTTIMRDIHKDKQITIGSPKANTRIYIVDKKNKLQLIGVPGEICISGEGLARGYLNNSELTAEKFIESPFVSGERMYKTGDLARWMPNGSIEFIGRIDHQVKIRGFRIELGEIESQLLNHESVKESIVLDREDENGSKYLCAYLVSEKELTVGELRSYLSKNLPEYMIPSYFVKLDKMPLTPNGKIDRKALPKPDGSIITGIEYEAPRNEIEEKLVKTWSEVLGVQKVGINDNFFELGGHSLKATTLISKIHKELNVAVSLGELFKFPTIKGISEYVASTEKSIYSSIEIVEYQEYYEASSAQKRMYMLQQFDLKSTGYNMPGVMLIEGKLNAERLEESFAQLIRRHETLRTSFQTIEDKIVQRVNESANFRLERYEVGLIESQEKAVDNIVKGFVKAFDLNKAPLLRVGLIELEEDRHILMVDMHHIISDGVSMGILINEFAKIYEGNELEQLRIQYKDYSQWQNSLLKSDLIQDQKEYWINRFKDEIPVLNMTTDFQRPLMQSFEGEDVSFKLDNELTKDLRRISKESGSTIYMVLLSGVNILLSKYSGQEDIIVGSPIAGRPHADLEKIIGMFVNTIAMRNHPEGNRTYEDFLKEVKENALKAFENGDYQFDELVDKLSITRDISRNPLFDVMFTMQNTDSEETPLKDLIFKEYKQEYKVAKFDLTFSASDMVENIILNIQFSTKLYKKETIESMGVHFVNILKAIAVDTKVKLSEIDMLTAVEKHKLLYEFNDTYADYPKDKTIHELFEEQAEKTPDNVAVVFEEKKLTYRELNEKANKLARVLIERGVKPDSIVGIMVERSIEMIVGIMGILKSGGAYLPIDPEYPEDRIKYILDNSKTNMLLTQTNLVEKIAFEGEIVDLIDEKSYVQDHTNLRNKNMPKDLAYIIYTSGTTGKPKGAMIEHRNVVRLMFNEKMQFDFNEKDVWTMFHSYCFDFSVWEMYGALLYGGKLVLISKNTARDTQEYLKTLKEERVTILNQIPTPFYNLMDKELNCSTEDLKLRYVIFGGEALKPDMLSEWIKKYPETKLINMYGITETTVHVTYKEIGEKEIDQKISNIGKPIPTLSTYIMDKNLRLQPIGVPGELCVGGEGVGRGYLNNKELTEEKFVTNTYKTEEKIYRSGDLVRMLVNGELEYLGRIDHQVKIRGFRIELGEIETQLLNHESVKEVIVLDREDENGAKYLCAYLVSEKELTIGELRNYLSKNLPDYMIPSCFVQLDKMPLTTNGKIDRKALPEPDGSILTGTEYEAPRNQAEEKLALIWSEVLGVEKVGINDNFFELGGHSLKATTVVSKIHKEFNTEISLLNLFKSPTIAEINELIKNSKISIYGEIKRLQQQEQYELSYAQKRLWIINQLNPSSTAYNMPGRITLFEKVNESLIKKVFDNLTARHESFRTIFKKVDGNPVQIINNDLKINIETDDLSQISGVEQMERREQIFEEQATKIFNLEVGPLIYVRLVKVKEEEYDLIFLMHHIISDGGSMAILKEEFALMYNAYKQGEELNLEPLSIQYKDFASWQNKLIQDEVNIKAAKDFWCGQLSGQLKDLDLPFSYEPSNLINNNSAGYRMIIKDSYKNKLKDLAREQNTSLFVVLLTTFKYFLADLTGQKDILIGTAGFGRNHEDLKSVIGYFVNTTVLRNEISIEESFVDLLKRINGNVLKALEYQNYPIELIVDELNISYPKISAFFNMLNMGESNSEYIKDFGAHHIEKVQDVKFDIVWYVTEYADGIEIVCNYLLGLFKASRIESIMEQYAKTLEVILENPNKLLKEFKIVRKKRKI